MEFNATLIVAFVSFIVFMFIMNSILYKPLNKIISERHDYLNDHYKDANLKKEKAKSILADKAEKLEKSKVDAKKLIAEKTEKVKAQKTAITKEAQHKATETINSAKTELEKSKADAQDVLTAKVVDLAQDISSKILGENVAVENVDGELISKIMQEG